MDLRFGAPVALLFSEAVWVSIARTGAISFQAGLLGCMVAAIAGPLMIAATRSSWTAADPIDVHILTFMLGLLVVNVLAATIMADVAHRLGILVAGPAATGRTCGPEAAAKAGSPCQSATGQPPI